MDSLLIWPDNSLFFAFNSRSGLERDEMPTRNALIIVMLLWGCGQPGADNKSQTSQEVSAAGSFTLYSAVESSPLKYGESVTVERCMGETCSGRTKEGKPFEVRRDRVLAAPPPAETKYALGKAPLFAGERGATSHGALRPNQKVRLVEWDAQAGRARLAVGGWADLQTLGDAPESAEDATRREALDSGAWTRDPDSRSAMDDSPTVTYTVKAIDALSGWLRQEQPTLVARCKEHKTEIYIVTGMPMNPELGHFNQYTVRLRLDDHSVRKELWGESTDSEAIFSPSGKALAQQLASAETLKVEVTPYNSSPQTIVFPVKSFAGPMREIAKACRWRS